MGSFFSPEGAKVISNVSVFLALIIASYHSKVDLVHAWAHMRRGEDLVGRQMMLGNRYGTYLQT